ncbi:MAG: hypothetical protein NT120_05250 [Candidatus Aenigmarchaeota archaeon]|nr:hypothetical protein [Candidatus Aenigmarchaeota archaeon]
MNYELHLKCCIESVKAGARAIENYKPTTLKIKSTDAMGSHAIVTDADYKSQEAILNEIGKYDKDSLLITEEIVKNAVFKKRIIKADELEKLLNSGAYIIDELDGSSGFEKGHHEWSVSNGYVYKMQNVAGAIFAPKIDGGILFYGSIGNGAYIQNKNESRRIKVSKCSNLRNAYVIFGPDNFLSRYPIHNKLVTKIGDIARTVNSCGSCAIALGLVAAGKADALVQPVHYPWDWAAGKVMVEEAGGIMIFYEMDKGRIITIDHLELFFTKSFVSLSGIFWS